MLKSKELDTQSAGQFAFYAARDARMRNYAKGSSFTDAQKVSAERVKMAMEIVYGCKAVHINYRDKFFAIKIDAPRCVNDKKTLALLEDDYAKVGVEKKVTAQGIIYRFPKA